MKTREKKRTGKTIKWIGIGAVALLCVCVLLFFANFYLSIDPETESTVVEYRTEYNAFVPQARLKGRFLFKDGFPVDVQTEGTVNTAKLGEYKLTHSAHFWFWDVQSTQTVIVQDTTAPEITLYTKEGYYVLPKHEYQEEGFSAADNCDGDLTEAVERTIADGIVTYRVSDRSGNRTEVTREIPYNDPIAPVVSLKGKAKIFLNLGDAYTEPGFTASDNCDGDITQNVKIQGRVDSRVAGAYTLTYTAADTYGNTASAKRTVVVNAVKNPDTVVPGGKVIYLTFDDGPGKYTAELLRVLDKYNVKATFFVVNGAYNHLIAEEAKAGHSIGIHSTTHNYGQIYSSKQAYFDDLYRMQDTIFKQAGIRPTIVRFPGGSSNMVSKKYCSGIMTELTTAVVDSGFQYFDWNVTSGDAGSTTSTSTVVNNVINGVQKHRVSIVLQHDSKKFSVDAVEEIIVWALNNGYTFLPLDMTSPVVHHGINN